MTSSGHRDALHLTACGAALFDCCCCVSLPHIALRSAAASAQGPPGDF